jgi:hypothetical protein
LKEIGRCVRLRDLIITLQVIIGSGRQSRMGVSADLNLLSVILIIKSKEVLQVGLLLT